MDGLYQIPALFLTALCHVIVVYHMSEHKYSAKKFIFYGCIFACCFVGLGAVTDIQQGERVTLFAYIGVVICLFLFSCIVSGNCFSQKCFLFITYFCLFSVMDNIMKLSVKLFLPRISVHGGYYIAIVLRSVALLLILALYKKHAVTVLCSLAGDNRRRWWNLALIALLFYLLQFALSVLNVKNVMPNEHLLLVLAALSFLMCAVYGIVFNNISYMKKDAEAALVRQNAEYLLARLSALQDAEETHKRLRHDMRHHLDTIAEYAKCGDIPAVLAYIGEYGAEISETALNQYSLNKTVNSIFSVYARRAEESGIAFLVKCIVPAELRVRDIDLAALLGNLLENALHGCGKSGKEKQFIEVRMHVKNNRLVIVCDNICPDDLELSGGFPTGKSIGISSILAVCRKYGGDLNYRLEDGVCSACAILHL